MKDIQYIDCDVGFLLYTGSINLTQQVSPVVYYVDMINMNFSYNNFKKSASIIELFRYIDNNPTQVRIINSTFYNNTFQQGGNLILS